MVMCLGFRFGSYFEQIIAPFTSLHETLQTLQSRIYILHGIELDRTLTSLFRCY